MKIVSKNNLFIVIIAIIALVYGILTVKEMGYFNPKAPKLTIKDINNQEFNLASLEKHTLVNFWFTGCPTCIAEMPKIQKLKEETGNAFNVLAVNMSIDTEDQFKKFIARNDYNFNFVRDSNGELEAAFGIKVTPTNFLINTKGRIIYQVIGEPNYELLRTIIKN